MSTREVSRIESLLIWSGNSTSADYSKPHWVRVGVVIFALDHRFRNLKLSAAAPGRARPPYDHAGIAAKPRIDDPRSGLRIKLDVRKPFTGTLTIGDGYMTLSADP